MMSNWRAEAAEMRTTKATIAVKNVTERAMVERKEAKNERPQSFLHNSARDGTHRIRLARIL
jgi:hypothetical protein